MLATLLGRTMKHLKANHLIMLRKLGLLDYLHPEVINHPDQAYVTTKAGRKWLKEKGIKV
jgi:ATP-dependent DNA helicase RecG